MSQGLAGERASIRRSAVEPHDSAGDVVVSTRGLVKQFGSVTALVDCSLELRRGEVHALLGENGSGKSTLAKILTGVHAPTSGSIHVSGDAVDLSSPADARAQGVVAVYQDILIAPQLSVLDNVWLGSDGLVRARRTRREKTTYAAAMLRRLLARDVDLNAPAGLLRLSDQQAVCIARALVQDYEVLVLDESTSALDFETRGRLFAIVRELVAAGSAVLFVSHRMDEIDEIADCLTVMRSGRTVATFRPGAKTLNEVLRLLTGQDVAAELATRRGFVEGRLSLDVVGLRLAPGGPAIDAQIHTGAITAVAGLEGHGQDAFIKALAGRPDHTVRAVDAAGETREVRSPRHAFRLGIAYVPRDRRDESTFGPLSVRANFELPTVARDRRLAMIRPRRTTRRFLPLAERLGIKYDHHADAISTLSGGNQQKTVLARWLAAEPRVLLLNDPTRGIDIGAKRDIYTVLRELRDDGVTVVILSSEVEEIVEVADRVLVFRNHAMASDLRGPDQISHDSIVAAYFGAVNP
jgi:ABC-type sugar transport system ATPase subunit